MLLAAQIGTHIDGETLFRLYASFVASFLYRIGALPCDINDLVQDVFMTAHKRGGYRPGATSPKTFLARICLEAKLAADRRDARWRRSQVGELAVATVGEAPEGPEGSLATERAAIKLQRALEAIEPNPRTVFILFELHGESCESIAAGLGIKLGTVYSRLYYARKKFFTAVNACGSNPPESLPLYARGREEAV